jgi:hypothetical protein
MDTLEAYWDDYSKSFIVLFSFLFVIFLSYWGKKQQNKSFKNEIRILIFIPSLVILHIFYFKYQHYTPIYLQHYYKRDIGKVEISNIVSIEEDRDDFIISLTNGTKLKWKYKYTSMINRNNESLRKYKFRPTNVLDYK